MAALARIMHRVGSMLASWLPWNRGEPWVEPSSRITRSVYAALEPARPADPVYEMGPAKPGAKPEDGTSGGRDATDAAA